VRIVRLALLDAAAIVVFAIVGMLSHDRGLSASGFARDALPLLAGWFVVALLVGTYRRRSRRTLLVAWAIGIPLGVLLRAVVLGRALDRHQLAFLLTTLLFTLLLVLALRVAAARITVAR
jgi:DUF3054 family protein